MMPSVSRLARCAIDSPYVIGSSNGSVNVWLTSTAKFVFAVRSSAKLCPFTVVMPP